MDLKQNALAAPCAGWQPRVSAPVGVAMPWVPVEQGASAFPSAGWRVLAPLQVAMPRGLHAHRHGALRPWTDRLRRVGWWLVAAAYCCCCCRRRPHLSQGLQPAPHRSQDPQKAPLLPQDLQTAPRLSQDLLRVATCLQVAAVSCCQRPRIPQEPALSTRVESVPAYPCQAQPQHAMVGRLLTQPSWLLSALAHPRR